MHLSSTRDHGLAQAYHGIEGMSETNLRSRWIEEEFTVKNSLLDLLPTPMASAQARNSKLSEVLDVSRHDVDASSQPQGKTGDAIKAEVDTSSPTKSEPEDAIKEEDDASSPAQGADGNANTSVGAGGASNALKPNDPLFSGPYGVGDGALYLANE